MLPCPLSSSGPAIPTDRICVAVRRRLARPPVLSAALEKGAPMDPKYLDPQLIIEIFRKNVSAHYYDTKGRVSRPEFWMFVAGCVVVGLAASIVGSIFAYG